MQDPISEFKTKRGIARLLAACRNTRDGLAWAWRSEAAFRQEVVGIAIATVVALLLPVSSFQKLVLVGVLVLVLIVEIVNSAIEAVVDRISLERHPLSKVAKDMGSAAVALSLLLALATWAVVLYNRFF
ncbi:diacylglycerol kinase [Massilia oculi]|uniref:Diacylglycerol kinase n=1 Tax=Massilia hydrophila TaxID=3044279 RepID=A0ABS7Y8A2_9BURK|nr:MULTISPECIES: diacylglycerol kinase [Massilia]MCA1247789.1 diacylglycerol kinase [Massilia sp. MS-15]MCA1854559.1 diacylglycerol kinase [Massilia oculi]